MLGDPEYRANAVKKIETYIENRIIPSDRLFITGESLDGKLDSGAIMRTIELLQKMLLDGETAENILCMKKFTPNIQ